MLLYLLLVWLASSPNDARAPSWQHLGTLKVERFDYCASREANEALAAEAELAVALAPPSMRPFERVTQQLVRDGVAQAEAAPSDSACRATFEAGEAHYQDSHGTSAVRIRRGMDIRMAEDKDIRRAQGELVSQWLFDETSRAVLAAIPAGSEDPAMQWARARAEARMGHVALDSGLVVTTLHREFGAVDPVRFGAANARQAEQLAQRYGIDVSAHFRPGYDRGP